MSDYRFSLIVRTRSTTHDEILDATDALGNAGCTDASIRGHADGLELLFERAADSVQSAISAAISDVERAGYSVSKVEIERDAGERLRIALDMYEFGESMMRQNLRRSHPSASEAEIETMLSDWLRDRPLLWATASELAQKAGTGRRI